MKPSKPYPALLVMFALTALLVAASIPAFSYVVYFKNGSTLEVQGHRVERDKVVLKMRDGEASFDIQQMDMKKTHDDYEAYKKVLEKARGLTDAGSHAEAAKIYMYLLGQDSADTGVRYLYGLALVGAKNFDQAIFEFKRIQELDPNWRGIKTRLGQIYYNQGKYNDAIDQFLLALDEDGKDKEAHLGLGMCYSKQEMYEGASTELYKAIELRPDYAEAYSTLGYVYYKKSEFDNALVALDKAVKLKPSIPEAHYYMGLVYGVKGVESRDPKQRLDFFDKSIEAFRQAVTLRPVYPEAHADLGVAYYNRGSLARAVEEFKTALVQKPDMAVAHNNLAGIYNRHGFYVEAVDEAKKAVGLDPHLVDAYFVMGNAFANMRKYDEAAKAFDRYLYYSPEGPLADEVRQRLDRVVKEGNLEGPDEDGEK